MDRKNGNGVGIINVKGSAMGFLAPCLLLRLNGFEILVLGALQRFAAEAPGQGDDRDAVEYPCVDEQGHPAKTRGIGFIKVPGKGDHDEGVHQKNDGCPLLLKTVCENVHIFSLERNNGGDSSAPACEFLCPLYELTLMDTGFYFS